MVNTEKAVDWAVSLGANGLEMDLQFDPTTGNPTEFRHGGGILCDCICSAVNSPNNSLDHVCNHLKEATFRLANMGRCELSSPAAAQLAHIATIPTVALIYIDSKVDRHYDLHWLSSAGVAVVGLLESNLFDRGYKGIAVIAAPEDKYIDYLKSAARRAKKSRYWNRIYIGIDGQNGGTAGAEKTIAATLTLDTLWRFYGTGVSSCSPRQYYDETKVGVRNLSGDRGSRPPLALVIVWTIDRQESMRRYQRMGVSGVITNFPGVLNRVVNDSKIKLATPDYRPNSGVPTPPAAPAVPFRPAGPGGVIHRG
jgi:hypothetical protein